MIIFLTKHHLAICLLSVIGISFISVNLHANESESFSSNIETETKDFLSDPARAGSLVGTILAGAAIANPLAPILGSIAGFFIGKSTDYTGQYKAQKKSFARRSFIPENNTQVASLSGLTGGQSQQAEQQNMLGLVVDELSEGKLRVGKLNMEEPSVRELSAEEFSMRELNMEEQPQTVEQSINLGLPKEIEGSGAQQQLAFACSNVEKTQQIPVYCYYYSQ